MASRDTSKIKPADLTDVQAKAELKRLACEIAAHDKRYCQQDAPTVTDAGYDALRQRNAAIEARFPELIRSDSPSRRVGAAPTGRFKKVRHATPMLLLDNAFSEQDVVDFVAHDPRTDEVLLVMVEARPWGDCGELLAELQSKVSAYLTYALDGQLATDYQQFAGKRIRFELRCTEAPGPRECEFLNIVERQYLEPDGISLRWQQIGSRAS